MTTNPYVQKIIDEESFVVGTEEELKSHPEYKERMAIIDDTTNKLWCLSPKAWVRQLSVFEKSLSTRKKSSK